MSDPIELHVDVLEKVFKHLSVNDLLEASMVSKTWYETIGASDTFKKKVYIAIHRWNRSQNVNLITDSTRDYQKYWISDQEMGFEVLFLGTKNWKKVVINLSFPWLSYFHRYLNYFTPTVRELKLLNCNIVTDDCEDQPVLVLPFLEELNVSDATVLVLQSFMGTHEKLKSLHLQNIRNHKDITSEGAVIRSFLQLNDSLKDIVMHADVTNNVFTEDVTKIFNFKLKSLTLCLDQEKSSENVHEHIINFLQHQGPFLETIKFIYNQRHIRQNHQMFWGRQQNRMSESIQWKDFEIIASAWNKMTALKKLALRFTKNVTDYDVEIEKIKMLTPNLIISEIVIHSAGCRVLPWKLLKYILQACPNVEKLFVFYLTKELLQFIALKMLKVKILICELMENGTEIFFEELKVSQQCVNKTMVLNGREESTEEEQQERNNWENDAVIGGGFQMDNLGEVDDDGSDFYESEEDEDEFFNIDQDELVNEYNIHDLYDNDFHDNEYDDNDDDIDIDDDQIHEFAVGQWDPEL